MHGRCKSAGKTTGRVLTFSKRGNQACYFSEHDVANVLKRFIRQLDEPLLTENLRETFLKTARVENQDEKLDKYRELLNKLPTINYNTLRRLVCSLTLMCHSQHFPHFADGASSYCCRPVREELDACL